MRLLPLKIRDGDIIRLPPGICECDGDEIVVDHVQDIIIQGWPDTVLVTKSTKPVIHVLSGYNITLRRFSVQGPGPLRTTNSIYSALISLSGAYDGLRFERIALDGMPNHGVADLDTRTGRNVSFVDCEARNGGNYGNSTGLKWDGAAFAVGVPDVTYRDCIVKDCIRAFEMENPRGNVSFSLDGCRVSRCSHVGAWVTPTGGQTNTKNQRFTGQIVNCTFDLPAPISGGFTPSGIVCTGGQDIILANNRVTGAIVNGERKGIGIMARADHAPLKRFIYSSNIVHDTEIGIVFAAGIEGAKETADCAVISGNIVAGCPAGNDYVTTGATNVQVK